MLIAAVIVGAVFAIGVPLGMVDYKPEATSHATIQFEGYEGEIHVELYGNDAPESVKKFTTVYEKTNDSNLSARMIRAFEDDLLYFGSPRTDLGSGGIKGEFQNNGVENKIVFRKGVIAVARGDDYNSGGSQFFIVTKNHTELNGDYAAFGKITSGMKLIEEIIDNLEYDENGNIINAPKISSVSIHEANHK